MQVLWKTRFLLNLSSNKKRNVTRNETRPNPAKYCDDAISWVIYTSINNAEVFTLCNDLRLVWEINLVVTNELSMKEKVESNKSLSYLKLFEWRQ